MKNEVQIGQKTTLTKNSRKFRYLGGMTIDKKSFLLTVRSIYATTLSVILVFGILGLSLVYGWIWFGAVWGTIAAILFQVLLRLILMPVADHIRNTLTKDAAEDCIRLAQNLDDIDFEAREKFAIVVKKYFGI
ncbi:MAG: hypothetical protein LH614_11450 [Pyrinomonadaceae bacterium]|nr:hypothetical protein [Pyrinomonadaceae bacterium]